MIPRIKPLPHWVLTDLQPAFYDTEAVTVLELLSKIYGKIEELINDYNGFSSEIETTVNEFIDIVNNKLDIQDEKINDAINYMKDNLIETVTSLYEAGFENGDYVSQVSLSYDEDTETIEILDTMEKAEDEEY